MKQYIGEMESKVLEGESLDPQEGLRLLEAQGPDIMTLFAAANRIRHELCGDDVHLCGIVNAKSGACSENCNFCSQSASHPTAVEKYSLMNPDDMVEASRVAAGNGAKNFGIVTAWKGIKKGKALDSICESLRRIKAEGRVMPDLSLGLIDDPEVAQALADAGAVEYNHNLESGRSFFPKICTTHGYDERIRTIKLAHNAGMKICCGGIFGLGETPEQRVELAVELRNLDIRTIPLNFYHHTEGNPEELGKLDKLPALEALKLVSMVRFMNPAAVIKIAGGRESTLGQMQALIFLTGANSTMVGHYLTTTGRSPSDDMELITMSGLSLAKDGCATTVEPRRALAA